MRKISKNGYLDNLKNMDENARNEVHYDFELRVQFKYENEAGVQESCLHASLFCAMQPLDTVKSLSFKLSSPGEDGTESSILPPGFSSRTENSNSSPPGPSFLCSGTLPKIYVSAMCDSSEIFGPNPDSLKITLSIDRGDTLSSINRTLKDPRMRNKRGNAALMELDNLVKDVTSGMYTCLFDDASFFLAIIISIFIVIYSLRLCTS
tara:strand:- start:11 stop:631 length:621 start_codon:yes stop_codon:yes gene_type:complete